MEKVFVTSEEIKAARKANLAQYLMSKGIELIRVGRRYKSKEHDSLVFTDNAYFWNSRQEHGNALDFVTKHMGLEFTEAVKELSSFSGAAIRDVEQHFKINDIELSSNIQRSIAYLNKSRNIDYVIIKDLIKNKLLFQSKEKSNIVFPIKDEKDNIVGAELNGTLTDRRFKGIASNSLYGYGFNIRTSQINNLKNYMFFESAIDLLSYINIQYLKGDLSKFKNTMFISMGGLKINIIRQTLAAFKSNFEPHVYLCVDNVDIDKAAKNFCELACKELKDIKVSSMLCSGYPKEENEFPVEPVMAKDWNEQLSNMKKESIKVKLNTVRSNEINDGNNVNDKKKRLTQQCR